MIRTIDRRSAGLSTAAVCAVLALAGCGGSDSDVPDGAVAVVNGSPITQASFDHWLDITRQEAKAGGSPLDDDQVKERVLSTLIRAKWAAGEAQEVGVPVTDADVDKEYDRTSKLKFAGGKTFEQYLKDSGMSEEDLRFRIRTGVLNQALTRNVEKQAGGADAPNVDRDLVKYNRDYTARWKALTTCADDLVIKDCSNYGQ